MRNKSIKISTINDEKQAHQHLTILRRPRAPSLPIQDSKWHTKKFYSPAQLTLRHLDPWGFIRPIKETLSKIRSRTFCPLFKVKGNIEWSITTHQIWQRNLFVKSLSYSTRKNKLIKILTMNNRNKLGEVL